MWLRAGSSSAYIDLHTRAHRARFITPTRAQVIADFTRLRTPYPYLTVMAQSRFLTFLAACRRTTER